MAKELNKNLESSGQNTGKVPKFLKRSLVAWKVPAVRRAYIFILKHLIVC